MGDDDMSENEDNETLPNTAHLLHLEQIRLEHNYSLDTTKSSVSSSPTSSSSITGPTNTSIDGLWPRRNTPLCDRPPDPEFDPKIQQRLIPVIKISGGKTEEDSDPIEDMGKYIHTILDSNDEDAKQCKNEYNTALAMNTKVHIIHDNIKHLSDSEELKSEESFEKIWNLPSTNEEDSSVKNLCESLEKLTLDNNQESDNSDSSTDTVIETNNG